MLICKQRISQTPPLCFLDSRILISFRKGGGNLCDTAIPKLWLIHDILGFRQLRWIWTHLTWEVLGVHRMTRAMSHLLLTLPNFQTSSLGSKNQIRPKWSLTDSVTRKPTGLGSVKQSLLAPSLVRNYFFLSCFRHKLLLCVLETRPIVSISHSLSASRPEINNLIWREKVGQMAEPRSMEREVWRNARRRNNRQCLLSTFHVSCLLLPTYGICTIMNLHFTREKI